jgi:hypothetical protein
MRLCRRGSCPRPARSLASAETSVLLFGAHFRTGRNGLGLKPDHSGYSLPAEPITTATLEIKERSNGVVPRCIGACLSGRFINPQPFGSEENEGFSAPSGWGRIAMPRPSSFGSVRADRSRSGINPAKSSSPCIWSRRFHSQPDWPACQAACDSMTFRSFERNSRTDCDVPAACLLLKSLNFQCPS